MTPKKKTVKKRKTGRRSVLTTECIEMYLTVRRRGGTDTDCANIAGIHPDTVIRWRARYEIADPQINDDTGKLATYADDEHRPSIPELFEFFVADKKAKSEARVERLALIEKAGRAGKWQAAAWWMERRYPDEYGQRIRQDIRVVSVEEAERVLDEALVEAELKIAELEGNE